MNTRDSLGRGVIFHISWNKISKKKVFDKNEVVEK